MIKVKALEPGFYIGRRAIGDVFDIPGKLFSKRWMERVIDAEPEPEVEEPPEATEVDENEGD